MFIILILGQVLHKNHLCKWNDVQLQQDYILSS
jgi:hypothetical protein